VEQPAEFLPARAHSVVGYARWSSQEKRSDLASSPEPALGMRIICPVPFNFASQRTSIPKIVVNRQFTGGAQAKQTNVMAL